MVEEKDFFHSSNEEEKEEIPVSDKTVDGAIEPCVDEAGGDEIEELERKIQELEEEKNEITNRLLRMQADFDNYRKRVRSERQELIYSANFSLVEKLLPVIDNLERASNANEKGSQGVIEGLKMIVRNFMDILEKEGLTPIDCVGKPFDPNCHEAVMREEGSDYPADTVVEEIQKGYKMNDKVLRASMVKVAVDDYSV
ncbi:MAG: nucleotide exchange factor GrpE [Bacillota bacterium]|nr:nucleotide exchange factor GrpE [Bacillota bacterium]